LYPYHRHETIFSLYIASEIAEENAAPIRRILKYAIGGVIVFHVLFWFDGVTTHVVIGGVLCHLALIPLLSEFPFVEPLSFTSILALLSVVVNHILWFSYFATLQSISLKDMMGFFLVFVWGVPLAFFVSMTVADEALPTASKEIYDGTMRRSKKQSGIFRRLMDFVVPKKAEDAYGNLVPGRGKRY